MDTRRNPSTGSNQSPIPSISDMFHHAGMSLSGKGAAQTTGSRFKRSTIHAQDFTQCRQWTNAGYHISDSAYHVTSLFHVRPSATQTGSTSSGKRRKTRISNNTVLPTSFRAGCCAKTRFSLALSHASCLSRLRAFAASACIHAQFPEGCGRP